MLSLERLTVAYGRNVVLDELSLAMEAGQVHGLVGRNGAGKTTLLETVYGFLRARTGRVVLDDVPPARKDLAYLPAESHFYPRITGREYLRVFRARARDFDADEWGRIFELPLDRYVDGYSTGMKKKLALLGTLSLGRRVILLDEPANSLDVESNLLLAKLIRALAESGRTVLVTSHVLESLAAACDRIHVLDDKRIALTVPRPRFAEVEEYLLARRSEEKVERMRRLLEANGGGLGSR